jgi:hypothetical protein
VREKGTKRVKSVRETGKEKLEKATAVRRRSPL